MAFTTPYARIFLVSDGTTSIYSFPFDAITKEFLCVNVQHTDGTVDNNVDVTIPQWPNGALKNQIVFGVGQVPETNAVIMIERITPETQDTDYTTSLSFDNHSVDYSFDKLTAMVQEISDTLNTKVVGVHPFQEERIDLQQVSKDNQNQYLLLDYENRKIIGGLRFELTDTRDRFRVSRNGSDWTHLVKSVDIEETRQILLENPQRYVYQYRIGNTWYSVGEDAFLRSVEALDKANQAVNTANSANEKSDNAVETSKRAETNSEQAVETSNQAKEIADGANEKSDNAVETANRAESIANDANATSEQARDIAATANATADDAKRTADAVLGVAQNAENIAGEAKATAESAAAAAAAATVTANDAKTTAQGIASTAQNALNVANQANATANDAASQVAGAVEKADNAKAAADAVVDTASQAKQAADEALAKVDTKADKADLDADYKDLDGRITSLQVLAAESYELKTDAESKRATLQAEIDTKASKATDFITPVTATNKGATKTEIDKLNGKIDTANTSGKVIGSYWFGKTKSETVPEAPTLKGQNYYDFTTGQVYKSVDGETWTLDSTNTPPTDIDVQIMITSKFWDIPEQENQHGGKGQWSYTKSEWSYFPMIYKSAPAGSTTGRAVADVFFTMRADNELAGAVGADGTQYNLADLGSGTGSLLDLLQRVAVPYVSLAQHTATIAQYGSCRAFGWDGGDVVAVPKLNDVYIKAGDASTPDEFLAESLPNITAIVCGADNLMKNTQDGAYFTNAQGAFSLGPYTAPTVRSTSTLSTSTVSSNGRQLNFSASDSNPVYKDGAKVQPDSIRYRAMVQLFNGATDNAIATATGVLADVAELKNMMGLVSGKFLVRTGETTIGIVQWRYNIYSNGDADLYGRYGQNVVSASEILTVSLPVTMANAEWVGMAVQDYADSASDTAIQQRAVTLSDKTTTSFKNRSGSSGRNIIIHGKADPSEYAADRWNVRPAANGLMWLPVAPTANGTYSLGLNMMDGVPTPYWGQSFVRPPSAPERYLVRKKAPTASDKTGYNIYSDGSCDLWGETPSATASSAQTVTLPIVMRDSLYYANSIMTAGGGNGGINRIQNRTTTSFKIGKDTFNTSANPSTTSLWMVQGYADPSEYTNDKWGDDTDYSTISVMTGDPSPFKFKAWTNAGGETVYTLLAVPVAQGDDMYPEDQLSVVNDGGVPKVTDHCGAIGIVNGNRAINGGGTIMGTPGEFDPTDAYVRNQALDTNGPGFVSGDTDNEPSGGGEIGWDDTLPGDDSGYKYKGWSGANGTTIYTTTTKPAAGDTIYGYSINGIARRTDMTVKEGLIIDGQRAVISTQNYTYTRNPARDTNG